MFTSLSLGLCISELISHSERRSQLAVNDSVLRDSNVLRSSADFEFNDSLFGIRASGFTSSQPTHKLAL